MLKKQVNASYAIYKYTNIVHSIVRSNERVRDKKKERKKRAHTHTVDSKFNKHKFSHSFSTHSFDGYLFFLVIRRKDHFDSSA